MAAWLRSAWRAPLLAIASLGLSILILPHWFTVLGARAGHPIEIETSIRCYIGLTMAITLGAGALIAWPRWSNGMRAIWRALVALLLVLVALFVFDDAWLWTEDSWIRYPTAGALIASGLAGFCTAWLRRTAVMPVRQMVAWLVLGGGFVFLGFDELMEVHEALGDWLEDLPALSGLDQDWITVGYAVIGALAVAGYWLFLGRHTPEDEHWLLLGYSTAIAIFALSQIFDSIDDEVFAALKALATRLAASGHPFPDVWFVLYHPEQLFNAVEEVLECLAAVLFLVFTTRMAIQSWHRSSAEADAPESSRISRGLLASRWVAGGGLVALVVVGTPAALMDAPYAGASGPFATVIPTSAPSARFGTEIGLPSGERLAVDRRADTLKGRSRDGRELGPIPLRQMLRGVRHVGLDSSGNLFLRTVPNRRRAFLPGLVWRAGSVQHIPWPASGGR